MSFTALLIAASLATGEEPSRDAAQAPAAAEVAVEAHVITNPRWKTPPRATDNDFPLFASHLQISGYVTVRCIASTEGLPKNCEPVFEAPTGLGFGKAAVGIVERGILEPRTLDGQPVEATIQINLPFNSYENDTTKPVWEGPEPSAAQNLAAMVAAQSMARHSFIVGEIDWGLNVMPPEQARTVSQWIDGMYVGRFNLQMLARANALVLAKHGRTTVPAVQDAEWGSWIREITQSMSSLYSLEDNFAPLKAKYCARYSCAIEVTAP